MKITSTANNNNDDNNIRIIRRIIIDNNSNSNNRWLMMMMIKHRWDIIVMPSYNVTKRNHLLFQINSFFPFYKFLLWKNKIIRHYFPPSCRQLFFFFCWKPFVWISALVSNMLCYVPPAELLPAPPELIFNASAGAVFTALCCIMALNTEAFSLRLYSHWRQVFVLSSEYWSTS